MLEVELDRTAAFITALTAGNGWTQPALFQTFDDRAEKRHRLAGVFVGSLRRHADTLLRLNHAGACIAMTINVLRGTCRRASEVTALRALFIDCDGPVMRDLALPPSISVRTKSGHHHYWLLKEREPVSLFAAAQRHLAAFYGSDAMVSDPSRVMRVPGFLHQKTEPFLVKLTASEPDRVYSMREVLAAHEGSPAAPPTAGLPHTPHASQEAMQAFRRWAAMAPRHEGVRNVTAFVIAAQGLKSGIPVDIVEQEARAFCDRAGIPREADAVLRSARRRHGR